MTPLQPNLPPPIAGADGALLRIAVPNKGSLSQAASQMLREAGYKQRHDPSSSR